MTYPNTPQDRATRQRKLIFRASRRGFLEMDLLMGQFARAHVPSFTESEMDAFERLLDAPDWDVYAWVRKTSEPPPEHAGPLIDKLRGFRLDL